MQPYDDGQLPLCVRGIIQIGLKPSPNVTMAEATPSILRGRLRTAASQSLVITRVPESFLAFTGKLTPGGSSPRAHGTAAAMRSSNAAASKAILALREWPLIAIFVLSTSGIV